VLSKKIFQVAICRLGKASGERKVFFFCTKRRELLLARKSVDYREQEASTLRGEPERGGSC